MIAINKLYGVLLGAAVITDAYQWYAKKYTTCATTDKINQILEVLCKNVPTDKRAMFACLICAAVVKTIFGKEISELDPVNTYVPVTRPPDSTNDDGKYCLFKLVGTPDDYKPLKQFLDADILSRLDAPSWVEYVAAGCLQILRELKK